MNQNRNLLITVLASAAAGSVVFAFANAPFTASLRPDLLAAALAAIGLLRLAVFDYRRRPLASAPQARVLRPALPDAAAAAACACPHRLAA
ncbi:MAG: hypothetical protein JNG83_08795 [Opitutaceae bacterium]|nr:hypothetical protein [Opitutaceae bacterium]